MLKYFSDNGIDIEISSDLAALKKFLMAQSKDDYPYAMDTFFDDEELKNNGSKNSLLIKAMKSFVLYLKKDGTNNSYICGQTNTY